MGYFFATIGSAQVTSIFALLALLLSLLAFFSYIRDTIACRTQPQRASWLIWSVLSSIAFFTQVAEGATTSLWFIGAQFRALLNLEAVDLVWQRFLSQQAQPDYLCSGGCWRAFVVSVGEYRLHSRHRNHDQRHGWICHCRQSIPRPRE